MRKYSLFDEAYCLLARQYRKWPYMDLSWKSLGLKSLGTPPAFSLSIIN